MLAMCTTSAPECGGHHSAHTQEPGSGAVHMVNLLCTRVVLVSKTCAQSSSEDFGGVLWEWLGVGELRDDGFSGGVGLAQRALAIKCDYTRVRTRLYRRVERARGR